MLKQVTAHGLQKLLRYYRRKSLNTRPSNLIQVNSKCECQAYDLT